MFAQQAVDAHNAARKTHSAPDVTYDDTLAAYAENWGKGCVFEHSGGKYGESLFAVFPAQENTDPTGGVNSWVSEEKDYHYSPPTGFSMTTGHLHSVSAVSLHFYVFLWPSLTRPSPRQSRLGVDRAHWLRQRQMPRHGELPLRVESHPTRHLARPPRRLLPPLTPSALTSFTSSAHSSRSSFASMTRQVSPI